MSLTTPLLFMVMFILLLYIFNDIFSLLLFSIVLTYVFVNYDTFFTDTMSASLLGTLQLLTGTIAAAGYVKMITISSTKYKNIFGDKENE